MNNVYEKLADALGGLPNGFPKTDTGSHLRLLEYMYTQKEAELACELSGQPETAKDIAERLKIQPKEATAGLLNMLKKGKVWMDNKDGKMAFRLAPFIVGSYEASIDMMNEQMARLVEDYMMDGGTEGIMKPQPALHRVLPVPDAVDLEWILPYDNVVAILNEAQSFHVQECICRKQRTELGEGCDAPRNNCLSFSTAKRAMKEGDITREEAFSIIKEAEDAGLVHSVSNVIDGLHYICNCCGCCCGILRGITEWGIENTMARANYEAIVLPQECIGCEVCVERCQVSAVSIIDGIASVDRNKCLGCGLCVTTCPTGAVKLEPRPASEQIKPPENFGSWEQERLKNRTI